MKLAFKSDIPQVASFSIIINSSIFTTHCTLIYIRHNLHERHDTQYTWVWRLDPFFGSRRIIISIWFVSSLFLTPRTIFEQNASVRPMFNSVLKQARPLLFFRSMSRQLAAGPSNSWLCCRRLFRCQSAVVKTCVCTFQHFYLWAIEESALIFLLD